MPSALVLLVLPKRLLKAAGVRWRWALHVFTAASTRASTRVARDCFCALAMKLVQALIAFLAALAFEAQTWLNAA